MDKLLSSQTPVYKVILSFLFSFLLSLFIPLITVLLILHSTILSPSYVDRLVSQSTYIQDMTDIVIDQYESLAHASGIEPSFMKTLEKDIPYRVDMQKYIFAAYDNREYALPEADIVAAFDQRFEQYCQEKGIDITDNIRQDLHTLSVECFKIYQQQLKTPVIRILGRISYQYRNFMLTMSVVLAVSSILMIAFLYFGRRRNKVSHFHLTSSLFAGSMMLLIICAFAQFSGLARGIAAIDPPPLSQLTGHFISSLLQFLFLQAILMAVVGGAILLGYQLNRSHKERRYGKPHLKKLYKV